MSNVKSVANKDTRGQTSGESLAQSVGKNNNGFQDVNNVNPGKPVQGKSPVNSNVNTKINTNGLGIPDTVSVGDDKQYGQAYTYNTPSGHIIEYNDTSGNERILLRHKSGTAINLGPDGSVVIASKERVDLIAGDHTLTARNGTLTYEGDLTLNVKGDFNVNVEGEYNVKSLGTKETVGKNGYLQTVNGEHSEVIKGSKTSIITEMNSMTTLGDMNIISDGNFSLVSDGSITIASKEILKMTSQAQGVISSPDINIAANNLSVFGAEGTIGGQNIIMYNKNLYTNETVWSKTINTDQIDVENGITAQQVKADRFDGTLIGNVVGNITGTAGKAVIASGVTPGITLPSITSPDTATVLEDNTDETAMPNATLLSEFLNNSNFGIIIVDIDEGNIIKNNIDRTSVTGDVSSTDLTEEEIRRLFRDPANRQNDKLAGYGIANDILSPQYSKPAPDKISYVKSIKDAIVTGQTPIGNVDNFKVTKRIKVR